MAGEQPEGKRCHPLHAPQGEHGVGAGEVEGVEDARMDPLFAPGRRTGDDVVDAGDLGGGDAHDRRGDVGITAAGHVATGRGHRDQALAGEDAGGQLGFEFAQAVALGLGEVADAVVGVPDIVLQAIR